MTRLLYMENGADGNYVREFEAIVIGVTEAGVVLDATAFYPEGGGQPSDRGLMSWDGGSAEVIRVSKKDAILHKVANVPPLGAAVRCSLDWELRHAHMRMHTAQHIVSGAAYDLFGARTVGNQIHHDSSRLDLAPLGQDQEKLRSIVDRSNEVISRSLPVSIAIRDRDEIIKSADPMRSNLDLIPPHIATLRVVSVEGFDVCPCAGTHVRGTGEIGEVVFDTCENKGKDRVRIRYRLGPSRCAERGP